MAKGFQKGHKIRLGMKHSEETKLKMKGRFCWNKGKTKNDFPQLSNSGVRLGNVPWNKGKIGFNKGKKHWNWRGGLSKEGYSQDWTETLRRSIRERDRYVCKICGLIQGDLAHDVHHIDYNKKNCNPDNLITLCHSCHQHTNKNREYWVKYFLS